MSEHPSAAEERARLCADLNSQESTWSPLSEHISRGLAYTVGSALGTIPPTNDQCLSAFVLPNTAGLMAGARAWSKHAHRSFASAPSESDADARQRAASTGWWGLPSGPVATINERARALFDRVMDGASWRNLHWLPHQVLVYEVRVPEGYGMRWSQDRGAATAADGEMDVPWLFRGFVEPMMEGGHEAGWRHPA